MSGSLLIPVMIFLPMLFGGAAYFADKASDRLRDLTAWLGGLTELGLAIAGLVLTLLKGASGMDFRMCGMRLTFRMDGFRAVYSLIAAFMWSLTLLFSPGYFAHYGHKNRYYLFNLLTLGATVGVFLSDDLFATFIFFEVMSFASYPWVAHEETEGAMRAAQTYLAVAVLGGMVTLMGMFILWRGAATLSFEGLRTWAGIVGPEKLYLPGALVFFGFAAKAGVFPLHIWLPKAHPVAPAPASALLSGILTKGGVFGILVVARNLFIEDVPWGNVMLLLGVITMVVGAVLAIFSVDLKRTLACSSMSQIGFILIGVAMQCILGEENALAARGTVLHMVNHSLLKLDLFMCAGTVYMNLHKLDLNEIRGYGRKKPLLRLCFLLGTLGIIGMPLFNGYISKSLLHEAILEAVAEGGTMAFWYSVAEKLFLFSGGMTAAYMTKLYICLFREKNLDAKRQREYDGQTAYLGGAGKAALLISALVLPVLGLLPDLLMTGIGDLAAPFMHGALPEHAVVYFSGENLKGAAISLAIGALLYLGIRKFLMKDGRYLDRKPSWLDLENSVYRPFINGPLTAAGAFVARIFDRTLDNPVVLKGIPAVTGGVVTALDRAVENPVVMKGIPAVTGGVVTALDRTLDNPAVLKGIPKVAEGVVTALDRAVENPLVTEYAAGAVTVVTRGTEQILDGSAVALRRTLFHPEKEEKTSLTLSQRLELFFGRAMNGLQRIWYRLTGRKDKAVTDHVAWLVALDEERPKTEHYVSRSVSFGLLLLAAALCGTLLWLLLR